MSDILFFLKTLVITLLLAALMQTQVGKRSVEAHMMGWLANSTLVEPLQEVAEGGAAFIRNGWYRIKGLVESKIKTQDIPGQRQLGIQLERSKAYLREQTEKTKQKVRGEIHKHVDEAWDKQENQGSQQQLDP